MTSQQVNLSLPVLEKPRYLLCKIGNYDIGACPFNGGQRLQHGPISVNPSKTGCRLYHGKLTTDVISCDGQIKPVFSFLNDVEIWKSRFNHDNVCAFFNIQGNFSHSFIAVGRIHLVCFSVSELRSAFSGLSEWAIETGRILDRIGHDGRRHTTIFVKSLSYCGHLPIHHCGRSHHVSSGYGMGQCSCGQDVDRWIVVNFRVPDHSAVAVAGVFAETYIGNNDDIRNRILDLSHASLYDSVLGKRSRSAFILALRYSEK